MNQRFGIGIGSLRIPLGKKKTRHLVVHGGPYRDKPTSIFGVNLAKEIQGGDIRIPTVDYGTPLQRELDIGLLKAVTKMLSGEPIYVGCMGGRGRTGIFLSVLVKSFGVKSPVKYVRANYNPHAVETDGQFDFVENYKIPLSVKFVIKVKKILVWVEEIYIDKRLTNS